MVTPGRGNKALAASGLAATFVGNGVGRFAYIALMPVLIESAWFTKDDARYFGAATLGGYLLGAPLTHRLSQRFSAGWLVRLSMIVCSLSYLCCAARGSFAWFFGWRTFAGVAGAILQVLAPYLALSGIDAKSRGRISGIVFSGVGLGVAFSGTAVPLLLHVNVETAWLGIGAVCAVATALSWRVWGNSKPPPPPPQAAQRSTRVSLPVALLLIAYALNAIGYLPHTLIWVDYIARELKMGVGAGGFYWFTFGIGAAAGPFMTGVAADIFGYPRTLTVGFLIKAAGVAMPLFSHHPITLFVSSFSVGATTPGIASLVSAYTMDLVGAAGHRKAWGSMTFSFAAAQAAVGYAIPVMMTHRESYEILFVMSSIALLGAAACVVGIALFQPRRQGEALRTT